MVDRHGTLIDTAPAHAFGGMWLRSSIALGSDEPFEYQRTCWLQHREAFVDIRVDISGEAASATAGRLELGDRHLRWRHEVSNAWEIDDDHGDLDLRGDELATRSVDCPWGLDWAYVE